MDTNQEIPTPRTDNHEYYSAFGRMYSCLNDDNVTDIDRFQGYSCPSEFARTLERELARVREQLREEQRLHVVTLNERDDAREQRDRLKNALRPYVAGFVMPAEAREASAAINAVK